MFSLSLAEETTDEERKVAENARDALTSDKSGNLFKAMTMLPAGREAMLKASDILDSMIKLSSFARNIRSILATLPRGPSVDFRASCNSQAMHGLL